MMMVQNSHFFLTAWSLTRVFDLWSISLGRSVYQQHNKTQVIHKVLWMPAREDMIGLKEAEGKWEFCFINWWGLKNGIQAFAGCGEIAPEHITSTVVWHGGCHPALGPAQEQVHFSSDVVDSGGVRRLLNFFGRITQILTQGVTHLEASDILWNLSAQALMPQQFPSQLRNPCCVLVWCKFHLSAEFMQAEFRV